MNVMPYNCVWWRISGCIKDHEGYNHTWLITKEGHCWMDGIYQNWNVKDNNEETLSKLHQIQTKRPKTNGDQWQWQPERRGQRDGVGRHKMTRGATFLFGFHVECCYWEIQRRTKVLYQLIKGKTLQNLF